MCFLWIYHKLVSLYRYDASILACNASLSVSVTIRIAFLGSGISNYFKPFIFFARIGTREGRLASLIGYTTVNIFVYHIAIKKVSTDMKIHIHTVQAGILAR